MASISEEERAQRGAVVKNAAASVRMEGLEASAEGESIFQRYVSGELTLEEMGSAIDGLHSHLYGPIRLPRNERP